MLIAQEDVCDLASLQLWNTTRLHLQSVLAKICNIVTFATILMHKIKNKSCWENARNA